MALTTCKKKPFLPRSDYVSKFQTYEYLTQLILYIFFNFKGVYNGPDRTGLAVDAHTGPNIAACCCVNGRGLSMFDFRMPLPLDFIYDVSCSPCCIH